MYFFFLLFFSFSFQLSVCMREVQGLVYTEYMLSSGKSPHSSHFLYSFTASKITRMALKDVQKKNLEKNTKLKKTNPSTLHPMTSTSNGFSFTLLYFILTFQPWQPQNPNKTTMLIVKQKLRLTKCGFAMQIIYKHDTTITVHVET